MAIIHFNADPYTAELLEPGTAQASALSTSNYAPAAGATGVAVGAVMAFVSLESANVRYHICGQTPASSCGHIYVAGDYLVLDGYRQISQFQVFNEGATATATLFVTFFMG